MPVYPDAVRRLIPPGSSDPRIKPRVVILHVAVSETDSLYDYFANRSGGIESHFYIRRDGTVEQYRDTDWQADANYKANDFAISVETQGMEHGEWGADQLDAIKALLRWCNQAHGIPLVKAARWDGTGVGYHSQFQPWSPVAKSCPGPDRIRQFNNVLVPWMSGNPEEDDVSAKDVWSGKDSDQIPVPANRASAAYRKKNPTFQARNALSEAWGYAKEARDRTRRIEAALEALGKALGPAVEEAVHDALVDAVIEVDVNVNQPGEE